jgi:ABC-type polysaccharide/polyol phosphate export permease
MAFEEKSTWILGIMSVVTYAVYTVIVLDLARAMPLAEVDYVPAMLGTIGAAIVVSILLHIIVVIASRKDLGKKDQRDRQIYRMGEYVGQSFVVAGAIAAMLLAMFELPHFWIANVLYLAFILSAILGTITKLVSYRRGLPAW